MIVRIRPGTLHGQLKAIASKSAAHRLLIAAALADRPTDILCGELSRDIEATADCLRALGAGIIYDKDSGTFHVDPVRREETAADSTPCTLDVGESGSTLRFLLPVVCALGRPALIVMHGRLPERPLSPLWEELTAHGCSLERLSDGSVRIGGALRGGTFTIAANISSQFISGLLFAIPLLKEPAEIRLTGQVESESYIRMTVHALEQFGIRTLWDGERLTLLQEGPAPEAAGTLRYISPGSAEVEGDWSNGAFWEVAGMLTKGAVRVIGLEEDSLQGDRAIRSLKQEIAAGDCVIDARDVPDLVPVMSVLAAASPGTTTFTHAERLRIKESDRIKATVAMLTALGADTEETADGLTVRGGAELKGGTVDSCNDHRIAMSAAVASLACRGEVEILGAEAVRKSYPGFWDDFVRLGGRIEILETQHKSGEQP